MSEVTFTAVMPLPESTVCSISEQLNSNLRELASLTHNPVDKKAIRDCIRSISHTLESYPDAVPDNMELEHFFADGLYGRRWGCKAGVILTTRIHTVQHLSTVSRGKIAVASTDGLRIVEAGEMFVTQPGTQRVILVLEDAVFTTVHANPDNLKDPEELTAKFTIGPFEEYSEAS